MTSPRQPSPPPDLRPGPPPWSRGNDLRPIYILAATLITLSLLSLLTGLLIP